MRSFNTKIMIAGMVFTNFVGALLFLDDGLYNAHGTFTMIFAHVLLSLIGSLFYFMFSEKENQK